MGGRQGPVAANAARNALLAALEARGPAYAERAARTAAGFADAPDAECVDLVMAATYAAVAGDPDAARRYVREARARWPDDRDARRLKRDSARKPLPLRRRKRRWTASSRSASI